VPALVTAKTPKPRKAGGPPILHRDDVAPPAPAAANDDGKPKASAIVTARKPGKRYNTAPDKHQRRGDGADEIIRRTREKQ
jgi:hypothetical protein